MFQNLSGPLFPLFYTQIGSVFAVLQQFGTVLDMALMVLVAPRGPSLVYIGAVLGRAAGRVHSFESFIRHLIGVLIQSCHFSTRLLSPTHTALYESLYAQCQTCCECLFWG
jgi:hypothetical protein